MLLDNLRVSKINGGSGGVCTILQCAGQEVPSRLLGGNLHGNGTVLMFFRRSQFRFPAGDFLLQISLLTTVHLKQTAGEIREITLLPLISTSLQIGKICLAIRHNLVHVDGLQGEASLCAVTETQVDASWLARYLLAYVV